jgi:serine/threonine protein kinase
MSTGAHDPRIGRLVGGKWRIERVLGEGATSTVYAASHCEDHRHAAIKVLRPGLLRDREVVQLFRAEGWLVSEIEHPGVVKILDDGTDDDCPFLVLEMLVGQNLEERRQTRGGVIPLDEVMPIADAIMETLADVHAHGVTHRDLKPQNVMVLDGGGIKLLDFGLAKVTGFTAAAAQDVVGTPSFMPPEQALGVTKKMDAQSDVWALGATLFFVLSGQPVHVAAHVSAMLLASASARPRSLADAAPALPRAIVDVIDRALSYRKADRWPNVNAMRSAWQEAHPAWLPTLPPPSFVPDPTFLDPESLVDEHAERARAESLSIDTPMAITLFDPRELALDVESVEPTFESPPRPSRSLRAVPARRSWGSTIALAATAIATVSLVGAAAMLAADDRPANKPAAARPPLVATELPPPASSQDAGPRP